MTALIHVVPGAAHSSSIPLLYLLVVIGVALRFGSGPAYAASLLAFLAFDWFFIHPRYSFLAADPVEWIALLVFLVVASTTGHLTASLQARFQEAVRREKEAAILAEASWSIAVELDRNRALEGVARRVQDAAPVEEVVLCVGEALEPAVTLRSKGVARFNTDRAVVAAALETGVGEEDGKWPELALVLRDEELPAGLLYVRLAAGSNLRGSERRVIESLANHAALVLQRDRRSQAAASARALAEADRMKTALLSMVSHDFRTPLASIKAWADAAPGGEGEAAEAFRLEAQQGILEAADRLDGMVGNILALSRLDSDAWQPRREDCALEEVIEAARRGLKPGENRRIRVELSPELRDVFLDPIQMGQVLHNLLDNALKYSRPRSPVEVSAGRDGSDLTLEVGDWGPGLQVGEEDSVFERFYRSPDQGERAIPGTGLGLCVCRGLVEAHSGTIKAENRADGSGVRILIRLPGAAP